MSMVNLFIYYAWPFILLALIYLVWGYSAYKLKDKFPRYYALCGIVSDHLPKVIAFFIIVWFLYYYWSIDKLIFN